MTTKPKAKKFRIRRSGAATPGATQTAAPQPAAAPRPVRSATAAAPVQQQAQPAQPTPQGGYTQTIQAGGAAAPADIASARETRAETDIDAIRREGLTGRQLRMARRVAQSQGLAPISDFDAVRQLRARGIDPFQRTNMLELVVPKQGSAPGDGAGTPQKDGKVQLPQTVPVEKANLPSTETVSPAERRVAEISQIQKDIARRRRKRLGLLLTRLSAFVFLPTILAGWYYYAIATPMYATKSEFLILQADNQGGSALGGLLPTQYATSQDSIAVQSYLQSKDAMLRLDAEHGYKQHFASAEIDPIQRLSSNPTNEEAYKVYKKNVKIGYDPTEGVVRMEVIAADPRVSADFARSLITYAEERVDDLSLQKRTDSMRSANESLAKARLDRQKAQRTLVALQEKLGADPTEQLGVLRQQISNYETQLQEKELQLQALLDNPRPNRAKVDGARGDVRRLKTLLTTLRQRMTVADDTGLSLVEKSSQIQIAQADLAAADSNLHLELQGAKQTALEANRQVRYLTVPVRPIAADAPSYPRSFENTILAFLIFSGIYLMISLTASILREQVSS
ncbi:MAG: capsule biosynthesis protein [Rhodobacterales bacterium]|nr:MAG: capsule biosynthesis protein [Rhodobacterales bacterium]